MPRPPKPPGMRMPSARSRARARSAAGGLGVDRRLDVLVGRRIEALESRLLRASSAVSRDLQALGVDPVDLHARVLHRGGMAQRLADRQVGVRQAARTCPRARSAPSRLARSARSIGSVQLDSSRRRRLHAEVVEDEVVHALFVEHERHLVDVIDVVGRHDRLGRQAREQRDLLADLLPTASPPSGTSACPARCRCAAAR